MAGPTAIGGAAAAEQAAPQLEFSVTGVEAVRHAAAPTLAFALEIESEGARPVRSVMLDVQLQIAARRRAYEEVEHERLAELFGDRSRWGNTLRTLPWARATAVVKPFAGRTTVELTIPCTYDFEVTASRYLHALENGEVPLELLFSGTLFYADPSGALRVARIGWDREAEVAMPVRVWREAMDSHFPGSAWLRLDRERFDRLAAYKARHALVSWEAAVDALLDRAESAEGRASSSAARREAGRGDAP
jgi:hypothetical protein